MNRLEEIKYRANLFGQHAKLEDTQYLLTIIEQAEKAIEQLGKMDDPDKIQKFSEEALQAIRKGD